MNNNGFVQFGNSLQGSGVTQNVAPQVSGGFPGVPAIITASGVYGNGAAVFAGTAGNLQMIARQGQDAPGLPGFTLNPEVGGLGLIMNNMNQMLFDCPTSTLRPGDVWGTIGERLDVASSNVNGPKVLYAWGSDFGLVPMLFSGQAVEVEDGVYRTIQSWTVSGAENGDGGSLGLNDSGQFVARLSFVEGGWSLVTLQIPAPGAGILAIAGLSVLARRRRNA